MTGRFCALLLVVLLFSPSQDRGEPDEVVLAGCEIVRGDLLSCAPGGEMIVHDRETDRTRTIPVEKVVRIRFPSGAAPPAPGERPCKIVLREGGVLLASALRLSGRRFRCSGVTGTFDMPRDGVQAVKLGDFHAPFPELKDDAKTDILIVEKEVAGAGGAAQIACEAKYGRIESFDDKEFVLADEDGREAVEAGSVRAILMHRDGEPPKETQGWFARVSLRSGDRLVGALHSLSAESVEIFSATLGRTRIDRGLVQSVSFVSSLPSTVHSIVLCDQRGVREIDLAGAELWSYSENVSYCWSARRTGRGTVLVANPQNNSVLEVAISTKETVWKLENLHYPYDAVPLANGNVLIAEYYANRVAEYGRESAKVVWQTKRVRLPISIQVLDGGNYLICSNESVVELKPGPEGGRDEEVWRANVDDLRPWRAVRLDDGNTLVTDHQSGRVVELDPSGGRIVWERKDLGQPASAIRLDNGNTLILEQRNNRIIETDLGGRILREIKNLQYPINMSLPP